jgi:2-polyprenyl-3-methyl-5-hydroxy-6-metoxy-1,4-benzoquinol methylase
MGNMKKSLKKEILQANISEHRKEAKYYDLIHSEIYNSCEQKRLTAQVVKISSKYQKAIPILDIGAGTGNITLKLFKLGFTNILALDISDEMMAILKKKTADKLKYKVSDIDSFLASNKKKYKIITVSSVLHHLPNYSQTFSKLLEILDDGGTIYITHEPFLRKNKQSKFIKFLSNAIRKIDHLLYILRGVFLILTGNLKYLERDCSISDYHTGDRSIRLDNLIKMAKKGNLHKIIVNYYVTGKFSWSVKLLSHLDADSFELIIAKEDIKR